MQGKKGGTKEPGGPQEESDIFKIVRMIAQRRFDPVIVFSFSKKECEALSQQVGGKGETECVRGWVGLWSGGREEVRFWTVATARLSIERAALPLAAVHAH
jgi:hypothetical protein